VPWQTRCWLQLNTPFDVEGRVHRSGCSIGVSLFGFEALSGEETLKRADVAMYQAKGAGRNTVRFFDPAMQSAVEARSALEADLRLGLAQNAFVLHYQPQVGAGNVVIGAEALLRWTHQQRGPVSPAEFIPGGRAVRPDRRHRRMGAADRLRATHALGGDARISAI
jgi:predicted signal transduction protein with EAL and GGDEF domain